MAAISMCLVGAAILHLATHEKSRQLTSARLSSEVAHLSSRLYSSPIGVINSAVGSFGPTTRLIGAFVVGGGILEVINDGLQSSSNPFTKIWSGATNVLCATPLINSFCSPDDVQSASKSLNEGMANTAQTVANTIGEKGAPIFIAGANGLAKGLWRAVKKDVTDSLPTMPTVGDVHSNVGSFIRSATQSHEEAAQETLNSLKLNDFTKIRLENTIHAAHGSKVFKRGIDEELPQSLPWDKSILIAGACAALGITYLGAIGLITYMNGRSNVEVAKKEAARSQHSQSQLPAPENEDAVKV